MKHLKSWSLAPLGGVLVALSLATAASAQQPQTPSPADLQQHKTTPLPFASIEVKHPIDSSCGLLGETTASAPSQLQNSVKNNFCAGVGTGAPQMMTPAALVSLQNELHAH